MIGLIWFVKFDIHFELEFFEVFRFRSMFTKIVYVFCFIYHIFLMQLSHWFCSYNLSLKPPPTICVSLKQCWIRIVLKSNILGDTVLSKSIEFQCKHTSWSITLRFSNLFRNSSGSVVVSMCAFHPSCPGLNPGGCARDFLCRLEIEYFAFENRLLVPLKL